MFETWLGLNATEIKQNRLVDISEFQFNACETMLRYKNDGPSLEVLRDLTELPCGVTIMQTAAGDAPYMTISEKNDVCLT